MSNKYQYWYWNHVFNNKQIKKINNFIDGNFDNYQAEIEKAKDEKGNSKKLATVKVISFKKIKNYINDFKELFMESANLNFGYEVFDLRDSEKCNLNIYSSKNLDHYKWHIDASQNDIYDIKLTVLINISKEKYEGGNFYIFNNSEFEIKELNFPGNAIMFKSYLNHKVLPVLKGERRTLALFLKGPKFR